MQYAWFIWSLLLLAIWLIVFFQFKSKESRREMLIVSVFSLPLALLEPLFVPEYRNPPSLFNLAGRTGFDIESFIFVFGATGLAAVLYEAVFKVRHEQLRLMCSGWFERWLIPVFGLIVFALQIFYFRLNPIYAGVIALLFSGILFVIIQPHFLKTMIISAALFTILYFILFLFLVLIFPGYIESVWNLGAVSGLLIFGVPLEELLFALSLGFTWSVIYEFLSGKKIIHLN